MKKHYLRKQNEQLSKLWGVAKSKKLSSLKRENEILYSLARFGWLTHHQVTNLLQPKDLLGSSSIRKILKHLTTEGYVYENNLNRSPGSQCKSYSLTRRGMRRIGEIDSLKRTIRNTSISKRQMDEKYEYHRLTANQILIDLRHNRHNLPIALDHFITEHELGRMRTAFANHFGCIPDGFGIAENKFVMIEIENSVRGPRRHGSKLTHWLEVYAERLHHQTRFSGHFLALGSAGSYQDVIQIFVCTNEKNFRSIWRKVETVMQHHRTYSHVFYLVMKKKHWVSPLNGALFMEHNERQVLNFFH
ncbi:replication-relaxation family protein [Alteromonas ponticola]|uniref:MarR family transcriptional regulator n=1 Tax=Alteromonas ponticola TaxID=2720613 RepID=A0ABX1R7Q9_9ALTE|nr:replication-relaxation family protein [Alteromonas ponticola]NMH61273.1 hypothetical protein [Alteromonas ponticola]